jgi:hypothetical protein
MKRSSASYILVRNRIFILLEQISQGFGIVSLYKVENIFINISLPLCAWRQRGRPLEHGAV